MFQSLMLRRRAGRPRGLTLIELMVVIAITGTLIALTAPGFKRMIDIQRLRGINAALITDLQFARAEAASRNQQVWIRFDKTGTSLTCYVIVTGDATLCNCKNTPGTNICTGSSTREIRTVQVERALNITVGVPDSQTAVYAGFDPATGRLWGIPVDIPQEADAPFLVEVKHPSIGGFLNSVELTGRPKVCSPSGLVSGVPACT